MGSDNCPYCDGESDIIDDTVRRCRECGAYFDAEDDLEGMWDRTSRHKTRPDDGYDLDE